MDIGKEKGMNKIKKMLTLVVACALLLATMTPMVVKADQDVTIHVKAPSEWSTPGLWAWSAPDGTNVFTKWPGEKLLVDKNNSGWFYYEVPSWMNSIIINEGIDGGGQTVDLSVEAKEMWVTVTAANSEGKYEAEIVYEAPEGFVVAEAAVADETPKTGDTAPIAIMICLLIVSGMAIIVLKDRRVKRNIQ